MKVGDIYQVLDSISPFALQAKWDSSGLNVGNMQADCEHLYVALELDMQIATRLPNNSLLIVHHPLIFQPLHVVQTDIYPSNLIALCLQKQIHVIAIHTNFDLTHLNNMFAKQLNLESLQFYPNGECEYSLIYSTNIPLEIDILASHVKNTLHLQILRYTRKGSVLNNLYITCGSNASAYRIAQSGDCIITGDVKYHDAMIATSNGIGFIDVPHFESECIFSDLVVKALQKYHIQATIANSQNPFYYV